MKNLLFIFFLTSLMTQGEETWLDFERFGRTVTLDLFPAELLLDPATGKPFKIDLEKRIIHTAKTLDSRPPFPLEVPEIFSN